MDVLTLARLQFALTIAFHYIFPPFSIGLGLILVVMEGLYLATKRPLYHSMTRFWVKIFGLMFAIGVATGIVMEFQFGTNWAAYSRFVGDIFGSALAAEGIFAFFLESGFLALLLFGWDRVSPKMHFFSTIMVSLGSVFSAVWIIVANSWQQTPAGYHLVETAAGRRAEVTSFMSVVLNPSTLNRLSHVLVAACQTGAFLVISVSAFYLIKNRHRDFAQASLKIGLLMALVSAPLQLLTGHSSAVGVARTQPSKLAAFEGHYAVSAPAALNLFGWVSERNERVEFSVAIPGMLSWLISGNSQTPVTGLRAFAPEDRPPINFVFQTYHAMVAIGMMLLALSLLGAFYWLRGTLFQSRWLLWIYVFAVGLPQLANQLGWLSAELGRQPWIVYGLLRTKDGLSRVVGAGEILSSLILFSFVYFLLFALFTYLLDHKIRHGPIEEELGMPGKAAL
ncbi:MAG: cytochrome ubiquinol oxidase subunit I [Acidobacteriota bacterium]